MKVNTFFQACVAFTIILLIFTLSVNFVSVSGFYPTEVEVGIDVNTTSGNETFQDVTGGYTPSNIWTVWSIAGLIALGGSIAIAVLTRSSTFVAIYLFSIVFWTAYLNMISITNLGNYVPGGFLFIGTASLIFIWMGAIIGMLSGSG